MVRRLGLTVMLTLLIIGALLSVLPTQAGAIRLAGVSVTWWYAIVLAPGVAALVALVVGALVPFRAITLWATPALLLMVAMQIFVATPGAPLVALVAMLVPMMAGLVRVRDAPPLPRPLMAGLLSVSVTLVASANFTVVADAARGFGLERWHGLALAAPIALVVAWCRDTRWRLPVVAGSVGLLAVAVVAVAIATGVTPWRAWSRVASRPIVAFAESSAWVTQGRTLSSPTSVTLTQAQRMTATSIATWRVVPGDGGPEALEWRVVPGDSLALQSGDQVLLPAGAGVRFESGHRVPGAPLSGVAWADATASSAFEGLLAVGGASLTLVGGGLALLASPSTAKASARSRLWLPVTAYAIVLLAVCWAVYAADVGSDLALASSDAVAFVRLPSVAVSGAWGGALAVMTAVAMIGLLTTAVTTLADRAAAAWSIGARRQASALRAGVVTIAAALALAPATAWNALMLGLGLAAAGLGPTLVEAPSHCRLIASVTGALVVASLAPAGPWLSPHAPALLAYPALLAIPLAAAAGWFAAAWRR